MALKFNYKAKDWTGKDKIGVVEANNLHQAVRTLQDNKLMVVSVHEKWEFNLDSVIGRFRNVSEQGIAQFTRLLSTMLSTGLPLMAAMSDLASQTSNGYFKEVIQAISHDIQSGQTMSTSMAKFPKVFSPLYVNMIKAGEASGKVDEALLKLADSLDAQLDFKGKVKGALLYPAIIVVAMGGIGMLMITQVIPKIGEVYKEFNAELPLATKILLGIGNFVANDTLVLVLVVVAVIVLIKILRNNKTADFLLNNLFFKIPIFGKLNEEVAFTQMTQTLSTLISAGVGIVESLKITAGALGNNYIREGLDRSVANVEKGLPLSVAFRSIPEFPVMISQLASVGEETGTLDQSLLRLSKFFQDSAERKVKTLTTALEPVMILIMGGAVGGLAIAVLMPMFNLVNVIK